MKRESKYFNALYLSVLCILAGCQTAPKEQAELFPPQVEEVENDEEPSREVLQGLDEAEIMRIAKILSKSNYSISKRGSNKSIVSGGEHALLSPADNNYVIPPKVPTKDVWQEIRQGMSLVTINHEAVDSQINWFGLKQAFIDKIHQRARPYLYFIVQELERRKMPLELALLPIIESSYQITAHSPAHASGLWQLIPDTGRRFGLRIDKWYDGRLDGFASTKAALDYLQKLGKMFDGNWLHAIAAYNCGEGRVAKEITHNRENGLATDFWSLNLPDETKQFVPRLLATSRIILAPDEFKLSVKPMSKAALLTEVKVDRSVNIDDAASLVGISSDEMYRLNAAFIRHITPKGASKLRLPSDKAAKLAKQLDQLAVVDIDKLEQEEAQNLANQQVAANTSVFQITSVPNTSSSSQKVNVVEVATVSPQTSQPTSPLLNQAANNSTTATNTIGVLAENMPVNRPTNMVSNDGPLRYEIQLGDSLWMIAQKFKVTVDKLISWNHLPSNTTELIPGQVLLIYPAGASV